MMDIMRIVSSWNRLIRRIASIRVTREQAAAHRERIVQVASTLFRKHGFNGIGVADIMKAAGLTHGGFYGHFASKDDLAAEASAHSPDATYQFPGPIQVHHASFL